MSEKHDGAPNVERRETKDEERRAVAQAIQRKIGGKVDEGKNFRGDLNIWVEIKYEPGSDGEERSDRFHVDYWESEPGKVGVQFLRITGDHIDRSFPEMFSIDSPEGVAEAVAKDRK